MVGKILYFLILLTLTMQTTDFNFKQSQYRIKIERGVLVKYNSNYIKQISFKSFKYNRTDVALNFTFVPRVSIENKLQVVLQAYKFASNEYRLFPMRFGGFVCDFYKVNLGGIDSRLNGNFTGCNLLKDNLYCMYNYITDDTKVASNIPRGKYLIKLQFLFSSFDLYELGAYLEVVYPEV